MTVMIPPTDSALLPDVARGDEAAVAQLVDRYWARAYSLAYRMLGDAHAAEDVAQEAFVSVLKAAEGFDPTRPFRPWFFAILTNLARKHHRARGRRNSHEARAARPDVSTAAPDHADAVQTYLARLGADQRESIALHYLGGLTLQEVADALACPLQTVASRVRRGLETLRTQAQPTHALGGAALAEALRRVIEAPAAPCPAELLGARGGPPPVAAAPAPPAAALLSAAARPRGASLPLLILPLLAAAVALLLAPWGADGELGATPEPGGPPPRRAAAKPAPATPKPADPAVVDSASQGDRQANANPQTPDDPTPAPPADAPAAPALAQVRIQLLGPTGPVANAQVEASAILSRAGGASAGQVQLESDAEGWIRLDDLPECSLSLDLSSGDLCAERVVVRVTPGQTTTAQVRLEQGASLRFMLTSPSAEVKARIAPVGARGGVPRPAVRLKPGAARLGGFAAGRYTLRLSALGVATLERELTLERAAELDLGQIELGEGAVLHGSVRRAGGEPAAEVALTFAQHGAYLGKAMTDRAGRYRFAGLEPGGSVSVSVDGREQLTVDVPATGEQAAPELVLDAAVVATVRGRVLGPDAQPRAGIELTLSSTHGELTARSAKDGSFEFADIAETTHVLSVGWGAETCVPLEVRVAAGEAIARELILEPGGSLRGSAAPGAEVQLHELGPAQRTVALRVDAQGAFVHEGLPAGRYQVLVRGAPPRSVEVRAGEVSELAPTAAVAPGTVVVKLSGVGAPQRFMCAAAMDGAPVGMAPGSNGEARLREVPAGTVDVLAVVPGGLPQLSVYARGVEVPSGGELRVTLAWPTKETSGSVSGRVAPSLQAAARGVKAISPTAEMLAEVDGAGRFALPNLPAGSYTLTVEAAPGQDPLATQTLTVEVGAQLEITLGE